MATTKFFLDCRKGVAPYPLKLTLTHKGAASYILLGVSLMPEQWDGYKVVKHPRAQMLNAQLSARKADIDCKLYEWQTEGKINGKTSKDIKAMVERYINGEPEDIRVTWGDYYKKAAARRKGSTYNIYMYTYERLMAWRDIHKITMDEITPDLLRDFESWMARTMPSPNSRAVHFDNIRAVCNDAIDDEVTHNYPFRKFKYRRVETQKRSLSLEELRTLLNWEVEPHQVRYRDMFLLTILLRGINIIDLANLTQDNVVGGRIEYIRAKTHRMISVKIEPEAAELIEKYRGKDYLVNISDLYQNHKDYISRMDRNLKKIGTVKVGKHGKKSVSPLYPKLSTYWARHTFATIAYNDCSIPMDVISDLLGHSTGMAVTNVYIRRNEKVTDAAARKVIDKILYDK